MAGDLPRRSSLASASASSSHVTIISPRSPAASEAGMGYMGDNDSSMDCDVVQDSDSACGHSSSSSPDQGEDLAPDEQHQRKSLSLTKEGSDDTARDVEDDTEDEQEKEQPDEEKSTKHLAKVLYYFTCRCEKHIPKAAWTNGRIDKFWPLIVEQLEEAKLNVSRVKADQKTLWNNFRTSVRTQLETTFLNIDNMMKEIKVPILPRVYDLHRLHDYNQPEPKSLQLCDGQKLAGHIDEAIAYAKKNSEWTKNDERRQKCLAFVRFLELAHYKSISDMAEDIYYKEVQGRATALYSALDANPDGDVALIDFLKAFRTEMIEQHLSPDRFYYRGVAFIQSSGFGKSRLVRNVGLSVPSFQIVLEAEWETGTSIPTPDSAFCRWFQIHARDYFGHIVATAFLAAFFHQLMIELASVLQDQAGEAVVPIRRLLPAYFTGKSPKLETDHSGTIFSAAEEDRKTWKNQEAKVVEAIQKKGKSNYIVQRLRELRPLTSEENNIAGKQNVKNVEREQFLRSVLGLASAILIESGLPNNQQSKQKEEAQATALREEERRRKEADRQEREEQARLREEQKKREKEEQKKDESAGMGESKGKMKEVIAPIIAPTSRKGNASASTSRKGNASASTSRRVNASASTSRRVNISASTSRRVITSASSSNVVDTSASSSKMVTHSKITEDVEYISQSKLDTYLQDFFDVLDAVDGVSHHPSEQSAQQFCFGLDECGYLNDLIDSTSSIKSRHPQGLGSFTRVIHDLDVLAGGREKWDYRCRLWLFTLDTSSNARLLAPRLSTDVKELVSDRADRDKYQATNTIWNVFGMNHQLYRESIGNSKYFHEMSILHAFSFEQLKKMGRGIWYPHPTHELMILATRKIMMRLVQWEKRNIFKSVYIRADEKKLCQVSFAIASIRFNLDKGVPLSDVGTSYQYITEAIARHMRVLIGFSSAAIIETATPSEPMLAVGAMFLLNYGRSFLANIGIGNGPYNSRPEKDDDSWANLLQELQLGFATSDGLVDAGEAGELIGRIVLTRAKDCCLPQFWQEEEIDPITGTKLPLTSSPLTTVERFIGALIGAEYANIALNTTDCEIPHNCRKAAMIAAKKTLAKKAGVAVEADKAAAIPSEGAQSPKEDARGSSEGLPKEHAPGSSEGLPKEHAPGSSEGDSEDEDVAKAGLGKRQRAGTSKNPKGHSRVKKEASHLGSSEPSSSGLSSATTTLKKMRLDSTGEAAAGDTAFLEGGDNINSTGQTSAMASSAAQAADGVQTQAKADRDREFERAVREEMKVLQKDACIKKALGRLDPRILKGLVSFTHFTHQSSPVNDSKRETQSGEPVYLWQLLMGFLAGTAYILKVNEKGMDFKIPVLVPKDPNKPLKDCKVSDFEITYIAISIKWRESGQSADSKLYSARVVQKAPVKEKKEKKTGTKGGRRQADTAATKDETETEEKAKGSKQVPPPQTLADTAAIMILMDMGCRGDKAKFNSEEPGFISDHIVATMATAELKGGNNTKPFLAIRCRGLNDVYRCMRDIDPNDEFQTAADHTLDARREKYVVNDTHATIQNYFIARTENFERTIQGYVEGSSAISKFNVAALPARLPARS